MEEFAWCRSAGGQPGVKVDRKKPEGKIRQPPYLSVCCSTYGMLIRHAGFSYIRCA
jgi:hypothetical protein